MEWVKVSYWRRRKVIIDGQEAGMTNLLLSVGEGRHRFELSSPVNYTPPQRTEIVSNTTRQRPLEIGFLHESQQ